MNTDPIQEYEDYMSSNEERDSYVAPVIMSGYVEPSNYELLQIKADYMARVAEEKFYDFKNFFAPMCVGMFFMIGLVTTTNNIISLF